MTTTLTVKRVEQQYCASIRGLMWHHWVYGSSPLDALRRLYNHPSCAPWTHRIARVLQDYNLGFGPVTDAHLAWGINMATTLPLDDQEIPR